MSASTIEAKASAPVSPRRLYRAAGWGGIGAFVAWAGQPVVVAVSAASDAPDNPDYAAWVGDRAFLGGIEAAIFTGVGVGLLFLVLGTWALIRRAGGGESVASRVGLAMGVVGAAAWLLTAGAAYAPFTSVGTGIPEVAPDPALQVALIQALNLVLTNSLITYAVGMGGWLVLMATAGRRAGVIGLPMTMVALLCLAAVIFTFAVPFQPPWGMIGALLFALILGIALLVKSRKA
ncbi:hypothetical protein [Microbacterium sp.]|uniref:hypothetical protein n=1 Tax=Microbacterium sp. TaxID=51671 RepID=UPI003C78D0DD